MNNFGGFSLNTFKDEFNTFENDKLNSKNSIGSFEYIDQKCVNKSSKIFFPDLIKKSNLSIPNIENKNDKNVRCPMSGNTKSLIEMYFLLKKIERPEEIEISLSKRKNCEGIEEKDPKLDPDSEFTNSINKQLSKIKYFWRGTNYNYPFTYLKLKATYNKPNKNPDSLYILEDYNMKKVNPSEKQII